MGVGIKVLPCCTDGWGPKRDMQVNRKSWLKEMEQKTMTTVGLGPAGRFWKAAVGVRSGSVSDACPILSQTGKTLSEPIPWVLCIRKP